MYLGYTDIKYMKSKYQLIGVVVQRIVQSFNSLAITQLQSMGGPMGTFVVEIPTY